MSLEKPFALTAPECDGMIAAASASGRTFMVAHVCRFWGEYVSLVEFVQGGKIGKPLSANARRLSQLPAWATWFLDPALSGGAVLDLSVHDFDSSTGFWHASDGPGGHEYRPACGTTSTPRSTTAAPMVVEGSEFMPEGYPFSCSLRVICEGGVAEFSFRAGGVSVEMGGGSSLMVYEAGKAYPLTPKPGDAYQNQADYFVACVREGRQPTLGTAEQAGSRCTATVRQSFETGKVTVI
jgi:predicted dehydrogenase